MKASLFKKINNNPIVIAGPTASGKSYLALNLAKLIDGIIINADSMQCYNSLPILTSQPNSKNKLVVPHKLYGYLKPNEYNNAALWSNSALSQIKLVKKLNKTPILVGGTGLYLEFLYSGKSYIPIVPEIVKYKTKSLIKKKGLSFVYNKLKDIDSVVEETITDTDTQRISRMWDVYSYTNRPLSEWIKMNDRKKTSIFFYKILLMPERSHIREACSNRFYEMLELGLENEILKNRTNVEKENLSKAIGFKQICDYLDGDIDLDTAIQKSIALTRQYAKRQSTWFNNRFNALLKIKSKHDINVILKEIK